jgi:hypothetical protein
MQARCCSIVPLVGGLALGLAAPAPAEDLMGTAKHLILSPSADRHPLAELVAWSFLIALVPLFLGILEAIFRHAAAGRQRRRATGPSEHEWHEDSRADEPPAYPPQDGWQDRTPHRGEGLWSR